MLLKKINMWIVVFERTLVCVFAYDGVVKTLINLKVIKMCFLVLYNYFVYFASIGILYHLAIYQLEFL